MATVYNRAEEGLKEGNTGLLGIELNRLNRAIMASLALSGACSSSPLIVVIYDGN